jgi:hypothetical protein
MNRMAVRSSNLASVGYDAASATLEVEFLSGWLYEYYNVPNDIYEGLMAAASHGTYFDRQVKKGPYRYHRLR